MCVGFGLDEWVCVSGCLCVYARVFVVGYVRVCVRVRVCV
jgi:hypothetical protein